MTRDELLKKAFRRAISNEAISYTEHDIDFIIIRNGMRNYLEKNNIDVADEEIETYIKKEIHKMNEALKDFTFRKKMMND